MIENVIRELKEMTIKTLKRQRTEMTRPLLLGSPPMTLEPYANYVSVPLSTLLFALNFFLYVTIK